MKPCRAARTERTEEQTMTGIPHPATMTAMAEEHRVELLAMAERHARARSAQAAAHQPRRAHLPLAVALAALLLALGVDAAREQPERAQAGQEADVAPNVTQAGEGLLVELDTARQGAAPRL
jgi:hypothetical protein